MTAASIALAAYIYYILIIRPKFSPLDQFPGPDPSHPLFGNLLEIHRGETGEVHDLWVKSSLLKASAWNQKADVMSPKNTAK